MNFETVKMFGMEKEEVKSYTNLQWEHQAKSMKFSTSLNSMNFGQGTIHTLGIGAGLLLASTAAADGRISPGDFVLVNTYVMQLFRPLFVSPDAQLIERALTFDTVRVLNSAPETTFEYQRCI